jgi:hypothetical protein
MVHVTRGRGMARAVASRPGAVALACGLVLGAAGQRAGATVLPPPAITSAAPEFNGQFTAQNTVDGTEADYASAGQGVNTFIEYTFGSPQSFDKIVVINRNSGGQSDYIGDFTLTLDGTTTTSVTRTPIRGSSAIHSLGAMRTATRVRLDVDTTGTGDTFNNTGAMEVLFVRTPAGGTPVLASVVNSAPEFSAFYGVNNAVDGLVGRNTGPGDRGPEYASAGQGADMFVDFDLGSQVLVGGFDFFDRPADEDRTTGFNLVFSVNPTFGDGDDVVKAYANPGMAVGDAFPGVSARYVRFDATSATGSNTGISEIVFYQVPEPSGLVLCAVGLVALPRRRLG